MLNIKNTLNKLNLNKNNYIVIGCSTGPDSMCLLDLLTKENKYNIVVAHINHNVRKQSIKEEKYLKEYCQKNNIIFESMKIESYKENNFENEARTKRYKFYEEILNKYNTKHLFLAHHGDDLIETILMKIVRGSNLEGYAGIKEISYNHKYYIVRPLINYNKDDIIKYNKENKIKYYIDKTNKDTKYTRNRYRKKLLPILKKEDININNKFLNYSNTLLEYDNYIKEEVNDILKIIYKNNNIDINKFNTYKPFIKKNIIYCILNNIYNNISNIVTERHINSILSLIDNNKPNCTLNLPNNVTIKKEYDKIIFNNCKQENNNYKKKFTNKLNINNHTFIKVKEETTNGNNICRLNSKDVKLPLYFRNKTKGDTIKILGSGHKKVKDIFIDKKIPKDIRDTYPILVDSNDDILWIPNIKKSQFNKKINENYDIIIKYCQKEENNE